MRNKAAVCIAFVLILTVPAVFAQETLSLQRARELALQNSRSLARTSLAVQSSLLNEKTQRYSQWPSLSMSASASVNLWTKEGFPQNMLRDSFNASISIGSLSVKIWDGGKYSINKTINSIATEMSRQDALAEYYSVLSSADSAYYTVLEAAASLEAAESSLATAELSLSMAEIRHANGMINDASYLQVLSEKASRETSRNQSRRDLALAQLRFRELLGINYTPVLQPVELDSLEELINVLANVNDNDFENLFTVFRREIQARNPSYIKAALSSERTYRNLNLAERDYSPTFGASLSMPGLSYTVNKGFEFSSGGRFSLSASIPLDFWVIAANVQKQKISQQQAALDFRSATSSLDIEISTLILDLVSQAGQIVSSRRALDYAQKHFDQVFELYRLSRYSPSELSDAETMVRNNRNSFNRARYSFLSGMSKIRSAGVFDTEEQVVELIYSVIFGR